MPVFYVLHYDVQDSAVDPAGGPDRITDQRVGGSQCWGAPLPDRELAELRNAVGALGAVGRNLNQISRVAHRTGRVEGLTTADLRAMLAAFERLRAHFKGLIEANIASWETDHAKANR